jgi:hypothetical protein
MISRYLNADPFPWLTDGSDPVATYFAQIEFNEKCDTEKAYTELENSSLNNFFNNSLKQNILGDRNNPDLVNRGSVWFFLLAVEYGFDSRTRFINDTVRFIIDRLFTEHGGFSLSITPGIPLACRTGDITRAMLRAGIDSDEILLSLDWITAHQRHDGSWLHCPFNGFCDVMKMFLIKKPGSGIKRESDTTIPGCPVATLSCIRALAASGNSDYSASIEAGIKFLLQNQILTLTSRVLYCGLNIQPQKNGYPVMTQFDSVTALIEIFKTSLWNDPACAVPFNNIMKKQTAKGTWKIETVSRGMINADKGENRLFTLNVLRMLRLLTEKESQFKKA